MEHFVKGDLGQELKEQLGLDVLYSSYYQYYI